MGEQKVYEELLNVFPKYKQSDLFTYKLAIKKPTILVNAKQLGLKMLEELQTRPNFELKVSSEINYLGYKKESGIVKTCSVLGRLFQEIELDAIVLCTGANT